MGLFNLINYENYILKSLVNSSYAKNGLTVGFIYTASMIIKFHMAVLFCYILGVNIYIDFVTGIVINVLLALLTNKIYEYVATHRDHFEDLVEHIIHNYTPRNHIIWKRYVMASCCFYFLFVLCIVEINNFMLFIATFQYIISFIICELLEHNIIQNHIKQWMETPVIKKINKQINIIDDYQSETTEDKTVYITTVGKPFDDTLMIGSDDESDMEDYDQEDEALQEPMVNPIITYPHWISTNLTRKNTEIKRPRNHHKQREEFVWVS